MKWRKIRYLGKETKYSALSVLSFTGIILLHLVHWLAAPMLMGAAAQMQMHHHGMGGSGSSLLQLLLPALVIVNLFGTYFAVRQLWLAWKNRRSSTHRTYWCSLVSLGVLGMGIYTVVSF